MLKFYCLLIGENYQRVKDYRSSSQKKVAMMALSLIPPVSLWFINGYLMSNVVLENSVKISLITAFVLGLLIYIIERLIIMADSIKLFLKIFRFSLAIVVAFLGSISFDEIIFKNDIDNQMDKILFNQLASIENNIRERKVLEIAKQEEKVKQKYDDWQKRLDEANAEMKGKPGSSGYRGLGKIARENIRMASLFENEYKTENNKLSELRKKLEEDVKNEIQNAQKKFKSNSLLLRIKAMFNLISENKVVFFVWLLITLFLFFIEFIVIILKLSMQMSINEEINMNQDKFLSEKYKKFFNKVNNIDTLEISTPSTRKAEKIINGNCTSIF